MLLDLTDSLWDLIGTAQETVSGIDLLLRKYPGDRASVTVSIDLDGGVIRVGARLIEPAHLLATLDSALD